MVCFIALHIFYINLFTLHYCFTMSDGVIRIDLYGKGAIKCRPYIQKTFAYETIFVLVLQNCPIKIKYLFDNAFWLADDQRFYYRKDWSKSSNSCVLLLLHKCPIRTIYILDTMFLLAVFWSTSTTIVLESFKAARSGDAHRIWYLYDKLIFVGTE